MLHLLSTTSWGTTGGGMGSMCQVSLLRKCIYFAHAAPWNFGVGGKEVGQEGWTMKVLEWLPDFGSRAQHFSECQFFSSVLMK